MKRQISHGKDFGIDAELAESCEQAIGSFCTVGAVEVGGAEVVPFGAVAQHVPGGGEHRGGHGDDGLLGAAAGAQCGGTAPAGSCP